MSKWTRPKIRFESREGDSCPIEATLENDGRIRLQSDPDSLAVNGAWLDPDEVDEFVTELQGLAEASRKIHGE